VKQGKVTLALLETMGIGYAVLSKDEQQASQQIDKAIKRMTESKEVYALVVEKDTFDAYTLQKVEKNNLTMSREEAIQTVASALGEKDAIVSTTGMISRELFEYRTQTNQGHERDFLTVGSMGHASQIALGIALEKPARRIWCFDGDGSIIMHMGSMAIVASKNPKNYVHVVFNNGAHDSVGGQPTVGLNIDLPYIARAVGYPQTYSVSTKTDLIDAIKTIKLHEELTFLEIKVKKVTERIWADRQRLRLKIKRH
jgi:phosphonopyruvate decarboxylase